MKKEIFKWDKYNRFTIIKEIDKYIQPNWSKKRLFLCKCKCWNKKEILLDSLKSWNTKSCWCLNYELIKVRTKTHWMYNTKIYKVWSWMEQRCNNKNNQAYKHYGWRWIKCLWNSFEEFHNDMWNSYQKWLTLDRKKNDWNYCKNNCRWITQKKQMRNTRRNRIFTYKWQTKCLIEWIEYLWLKNKTVYSRIYTYKWSLQRALELN